MKTWFFKALGFQMYKYPFFQPIFFSPLPFGGRGTPARPSSFLRASGGGQRTSIDFTCQTDRLKYFSLNSEASASKG